MTQPMLDPHHESDIITPPTLPEAHPAERPAGLTLRISKPNWQVTALLLIALIAGFQTYQLIRLKDSVSAKTVATASAAPSTASSTATGSDVPSQVGGC